MAELSETEPSEETALREACEAVEQGDIPKKDQLSVHMNVGPKLSDASTDELSDIEEEILSKGICKNCRRSRACCITLYLWIVLFCIGSIVGIIVMGILVVMPYLKADTFNIATCAGVNYMTLYNGAELKCSCGKRCNSGYPCIEVTVDFTATTGSKHRSVLHDDEATLGKPVSTIL